MKRLLLTFILGIMLLGLVQALPTVTLTSPADNYYPVSTTNVLSATFTQASNVSLWTNSTGVWTVNQTNLLATGGEISNGITDDATSGSTTEKSGVNIAPNVGVTVTSLRKYNADASTKGYIINNVTGVVIDSCTFSGDWCTFSSPVELTAGINYSLAGDADGASFQPRRKNAGVTYPITDTDINWVSCYKGDGCGAGQLYTIQSVNISAATSKSFSLITDKGYIWNFQVCNSSGSCAFASANRTVSSVFVTINSATYNPTALETSTQNFILNMSYNSSIFSSATTVLVYNGSNYATNVTSVGGNTIFTSSITIPTTSVIANRSFYWAITLGTTNINTTNYYQVVSPISFGLCTPALNISVINFTTRNAVSPNSPINSIFRSTWSISSSINGENKNYSYQSTTEVNSSYAFCTSSNDPIYANSIITYDATGYAPNSYYIYNATLNNVTQNISLYLLNDTSSTVTVLKALDTAQQGVSGVTVYIESYDAGTGTFSTVGIVQTDFNGEAVTYLNWYDTYYKFVLVSNSEMILTTGTTKISATPVILNIPSANTFIYDKFQDFQYSLTYNNVSQNFVLTFVKPSSLVDSGCLRVTKRTAANDTEICLVCETSSSATVSCNIGGYGNGTYIATFYATGSWKFIDFITQIIGGDFSQTIFEALGNDDATFYAMFLAGLVVSVSVISPVFGIVGMILGLLAGAALGFSQMSIVMFTTITLVGGIIIWLIRR